MFDRKLQPAILNTGNWTVTHNLNDFLILNAQAAGASVYLTGPLLGSFTPPEGIAYAPPPFDVIGRNGVPAAAFPKIPFV